MGVETVRKLEDAAADVEIFNRQTRVRRWYTPRGLRKSTLRQRPETSLSRSG